MAYLDTALNGQHRKASFLESKSYDPMEYATIYSKNKMRYAEQFHIEKTRPIYKGGNKNDIRHSMLAYTDYVTQRQKRNKLVSTARNNLLEERRQPVEVSQDLQVQATHIPSARKTPPEDIKQPHGAFRGTFHRKAAPAPKHDRVGKPHSVEISKSVDSPTLRLDRGNTFPPIANNNTGVVNSHKIALSSRTEDGHGRTHVDTSTNSPEGRTSADLRPSPPTVSAWDVNKEEKCVHSPTEDGHLDNYKSPESAKVDNREGKAHSSYSVSETLNWRNSKKGGTEAGMTSTYEVSPARKEYSEKLLKSAIETLKLMEKQLDSSKKRDKNEVDLEKFKEKKAKIIKIKKIKRLKLPKQNLDMIPELDCEYSFASDGYLRDAKNLQRMDKQSEVQKSDHFLLSSMEEHFDANADIFSTESEHSDNGVFTRGNPSSDDVYKDNESFNFLPPIYQDSNFLISKKAKKSKAKLDMTSKIKRKSNKLFYHQQEQVE